ncbi:MAG: DUF1840 domain-containing protein [Candidatus Competibacteraceae bacterium]|nr:DUF1840 domain-containing protein [Candidatus Competibacteraceae bacterium]
MIVTFKTKAHADIMMFGDIAVKLLKLMGHSGTVPSAMVAEDVPAALASLKKAIEAHKTANPQSAKPVKPAKKDDDEPEEIPVDLAQRALPLIQLLEAAAAAKADVMWDQ